MADVQRTRTGEREIITISGDLTLKHAKALKEALLEVIRTAPAVELAVREVSDLDISFPQLVCSAHSMAVDQNKPMTITGLDQEPLNTMLRKAGFMRHIGCRDNTRKTCLWLHSTPAP